MNSNWKLSCAIATVLGLVAGEDTRASDQAAASSEKLAEIVVTAQRRSENLQDVPISIQVLTSETLTQLSVSTFDDFVRYLPNVTSSGLGPGQSDLYMRGLASTPQSLPGSGITDSFPSVALYLDEQSVQLPGRNLDIYAADLERIEVLEGPQGTLFGAGAQGGVIRYITNKPKLNRTEGRLGAGYATTSHGDDSRNIEAMINLPLIDDKLAVRGVIYDDKRGGYIRNIPGTFTRSNDDVGIAYLFGGTLSGNTVITPGTVPPGSPSINNDASVGDAINPVVYKGLRMSALYQIDQDWSALLVHSYQKMRADGVFSQTVETAAGQTLPDLSTQQYNPSTDFDKFNNTSLTINGRIDQLKVIYTGGYLSRTIDQVQDYTNYSRGKYAAYYQCILPGSPFVNYYATNPGNPGACFSPSATWRDHARNTHQSHELRVSTPDEWRVRTVGGVFWEDYKIQDETDFNYMDPEAGFNPIAPPTGATVVNPGPRNAHTSFFNDITRGYKQTAAFASIDVDVVPKTLTITAGMRYYNIKDYAVGAKVGAFGCRPGGIYSSDPVPNPCVDGYSAVNLDALNLRHKYTGLKSRANISWKITPDLLVYYTWSQGFRPGGYNRGAANIASSSPVYGLYNTPLAYAPDTLTNKEIGWKTSWLDHRVQFDGAIFQENWKNVQIALYDPGILGNLIFTTNGPDYRVRGVEIQLAALVTTGLTLMGSAAWNSSDLTNAPVLIGNDGKPLAVNPFGQTGTPLSNSPPFAGNLRARYEFNVGDYGAFVQIGGTHQGHSYSTTDRLSTDLRGKSIAYDQPGYSTLDGSVGISRDAWAAQIYGQNLTDTRAGFLTFATFVKSQTVIRPRTIGLSFTYKFSGAK